MIRSLDKLVQIVGFLIIPIGIVLFGQQYLLGDSSIKTSMQAMVAAIIGMIGRVISAGQCSSGSQCNAIGHEKSSCT